MTKVDSVDRHDDRPPVTPGGVAGFTLALIVVIAAPFIIDGNIFT